MDLRIRGVQRVLKAQQPRAITSYSLCLQNILDEHSTALIKFLDNLRMSSNILYPIDRYNVPTMNQ
jgi:hypothetical protein